MENYDVTVMYWNCPFQYLWLKIDRWPKSIFILSLLPIIVTIMGKCPMSISYKWSFNWWNIWVAHSNLSPHPSWSFCMSLCPSVTLLTQCHSVSHAFGTCHSVSHAIGTQCHSVSHAFGTYHSVSHAFGTENISVLSTSNPHHSLSSLPPACLPFLPPSLSLGP